MGLSDVTIYRLQYTNFEQKLCTIDIQDQSTLSEFPTGTVYKNLSGGNVVARLSTADSSDDKLTPIKGQFLEIVFDKDEYSLSTFTKGDDQRWKVTAYYNFGNAVFFQGFLVMDDNREPYQDYTQVTLTATDGLGLLSLVPISDFTGNRLNGQYKKIDYVAFCLAKTGLQLKIKVVDNLFETTQPNRSVDISNGPYHQLYFNANTYEKDISAIGLINQVEDCYTVLRKILHPHSRLEYYNGDWWIVRLDEMKNLGRSYTVYNWDGAVIEGITETFWPNKEIGDSTYKTFFINQDAGVVLKRPLRTAALQYRLEPPSEILCNSKFTRGVFSSPLSVGGTTVSKFLSFTILPDGLPDKFAISFVGTDAAFPAGWYGWIKIDGPAFNSGFFYVYKTRIELGATIFNCDEDVVNENHDGTLQSFGYSASFPECWTLVKGFPSLGVPDANGFIKVVFDGQYERERYLQISQSGSDNLFYFRSDVRIPVGSKDKISFSVDFRYNVNIGSLGNNVDIAQIRLYGDNGSHWILAPTGLPGSPSSPVWIKSNVSWTIGNQYLEFTGDANQTNFTQWQTVSVTSAPCPIDGEIEIFLVHRFHPDLYDKHFNNISVEYIPYINGSYQKYSAEEYRVTQAAKLTAKREEEIFISGSPRKLFKGALHVFDGTNFHLAKLFNDWTIAPAGFGAERYGKWQAYAMYNQYRLVQRVFEMSLQGLQSSEVSLHCGLIHRYLIQNISEHNLNKYFLLLSCSQDWSLCEWRGVFAEYNYNPDSRSFGDIFLFKYLF